MDPIVIIILIAVLLPVAVIWALSKSASMRGPMPRAESRRPVETLVTEALPEEHPDKDADERGPDFDLSRDDPNDSR